MAYRPPWGLNWMRYHPDNRVDFAHIEAMQYKWLLLYEWMWSDRDFCRELLAVVPSDCSFILRDHPLSEQKQDLYGSPIVTGTRHAREWAQKWREGRVFIPKDRCRVQGINEPDSNFAQREIDSYTTAFVQGAAGEGIRVSGWVFGTGHPSTVNLNPAQDVDWHWYAESAAALKQYGGLADFHAYGSWDNFLTKYHLLRVKDCPYELPCVFSEFGIDEGTVGNPGQGWSVNLGPEEYAEWLDDAQDIVVHGLGKSKLDLRGLLIFCYDTNSDWKTFNIATPEMRAALEKQMWTPVDGVAVEKPTVHIPVVIAPGPQPSSPDIGLSEDEKFRRAIDWLLPWEGELSLDPNDPGNYYGGKLVGTKFGISAAAWGGQYDIPNLTRQQAESIYRQHYWMEGLDWPLCLLFFDSAVQHGKGTAEQWLEEGVLEPWAYIGARIRYYVNIPHFDRYGRAWMRRIADLMEEVSSYVN